MKQQITTLFAGGVLALALFGAAMAGPLEDGQAAVRHGDYATAMQYFRVLADQGNAVAQNNLGFMYDQGLPLGDDLRSPWITSFARVPPRRRSPPGAVGCASLAYSMPLGLTFALMSGAGHPRKRP